MEGLPPNSPDLEERCPASEAEWAHYFDLRWRVLRAPWDQPPGSERDELDATGFHLGLWADGEPVAIGRAHLNSPAEAQVRYMAVEPSFQGRSLGSRVLNGLESWAATAGASEMVLNAREEATEFYRRQGYRVIGEAGLLFGVIPHWKMKKELPRKGEST